MVYRVLFLGDNEGAARALAQAGFLVRTPRGAPATDDFDVDLAVVSGAVQSVRELRRAARCPVVALCDGADEDAALRCLEAGADRVLTLPIGRRELVARLRAAVEWSRRADAGEERLDTGDVRVDVAAHVARCAGRALELTPTEFRLLAALARRAGGTARREELVAEVWGDGASDAEANLRLYVLYLRRKLGDDPARPQIIVSERGVGYRLAAAGAGA